MRTILARLLAAVLLLGVAVPSVAAERPLTVLISIDAFRADYLDRGVTPVLSGLAAHGARAAMRPSFPSKTFPNHYTLVTGRRPDETGIVANNMRDPAIPGVTFGMGNRDAVRDARWWDGAEPIWVTAEKAGIVTAPIFWPGSEAAIHGIRPHYFLAFDQNMASDARVDQDLAMLDKPAAERPRFLTLYFDIVDTAGHRFGPDSNEVNQAAATVDAAIGRLLAGLKMRGIVANVVVVADHGMAATAPERSIYLDDLIAKDAYKALDMGPIGTIFPTAGHEAEVEAALSAPHPHLQCWPKAKIPAQLHYGQNPRVAPIVCLPQTGWLLTTHDYHPKEPSRGEHGYDNASPEMAAIFVASGPAFRAGVRLKTFDNVDVYPLLARLVGVAPEPNDGKFADLAPALAH
ncbi:ectonucleotide pyrophosphatase/phosphodiesterase [Phenylobacterium sp.]|uniref:alkaline phosphatase family protein n=1 Tax=Phenylobacterium sp. TaxID=1871053 RepID=UPI0025FAEBF3|nr:ectonucleotide pyrophosphatase/phosphodiesterase [Phenylobacterium sp.]